MAATRTGRRSTKTTPPGCIGPSSPGWATGPTPRTPPPKSSWPSTATGAGRPGNTQPAGARSQGGQESFGGEVLGVGVFLAALRPLRLTASVGEIRAYLRTTARTVLAAHWRETMGREINSIEDIEQPPDSEEAISTAPQRVAKVLAHLLDRYRQILEKRFL